jgi:hypothetical protein
MSLLYKDISSATTPIVNLSATDIDAINANQNSLVLDLHLPVPMTINLPSIASLLNSTNPNSAPSGAGAMTFFVKGNIVSNVTTIPVTGVTLVPALGDDICGSTVGMPVSGIGTCFHLFIAGIHRWGYLVCQVIAPPPIF